MRWSAKTAPNRTLPRRAGLRRKFAWRREAHFGLSLPKEAPREDSFARGKGEDSGRTIAGQQMVHAVGNVADWVVGVLCIVDLVQTNCPHGRTTPGFRHSQVECGSLCHASETGLAVLMLRLIGSADWSRPRVWVLNSVFQRTGDAVWPPYRSCRTDGVRFEYGEPSLSQTSMMTRRSGEELCKRKCSGV